jgi:hypothetical protein
MAWVFGSGMGEGAMARGGKSVARRWKRDHGYGSMRGFVGIFLTMVILAGQGGAEDLARQEIPSRFAPAEMIQPALREVLSAEGRFVILKDKGTILVIDRPEKIFEAAAAIEALDVPAPQVLLNLGVRTGGQRAPARVLGPVNAATGFPYPTRYLPPRVPSVVTGNGGVFPVLPAHPTGFVRRNVGDSMETTPTVNPDGSITLDINVENVQFEGFINYGSPILRAGGSRGVPILNRARVPRGLHPLIEGAIGVPVFETIRFSTSVVVEPKVTGNKVRVGLLPEMTVFDESGEIEETKVDLSEYRTEVEVENGKLATVKGFEGASDAFNRCFFCDENQPDGETALVIKAQIQPGAVGAVSEGE